MARDAHAERRRRLEAARFYGIVDLGYLKQRSPGEACRAMVQGGVDIVQLRGKQANSATLLAAAKEMADAMRKAPEALWVVNDHPEIAAESGADGVHVGQDDGALEEVRKRLAPGQLVGRSTHSLEQALQAQEEGADYIGVGPIFATPTKPSYIPVGPELIAQVNAAVRLPRFCIGGIKLSNIEEVVRAGAPAVVIVSGILEAPDPAAYCRNVRTLLDTLLEA